jgi:hypothetical protein
MIPIPQPDHTGSDGRVICIMSPYFLCGNQRYRRLNNGTATDRMWLSAGVLDRLRPIDTIEVVPRCVRENSINLRCVRDQAANVIPQAINAVET